MQLKCDDCRFYHQGQCRAHPPTVTSEGGSFGTVSVTVWPKVYPTDWCGEARPKGSAPHNEGVRIPQPLVEVLDCETGEAL